MLFSRDYRRPFWRGLLHAIFVSFYSLFIALLLLSLEKLYDGGIGTVIQTSLSLFILVVSVAVYGYLIFIEPMKMIMHKHFKAGSVMMWSTLGWLFVFLFIFILGLAYTLSM